MHRVRTTAAWVLADERAPEAPSAGYGAACLACPAESTWVADDPTPVELWVLDHTSQHGLAHSQFVVTTQRHWHVLPRTSATGQLGSVLDTVRLPRVGVTQPHSVRAHARPRDPWRIGRLLPRAGRVRLPHVAVSAIVVASMLLALVMGAAPAVGTG